MTTSTTCPFCRDCGKHVKLTAFVDDDDLSCADCEGGNWYYDNSVNADPVPVAATHDHTLSLARRLRKAGCHSEAQRLRSAVQHAQIQDTMRDIGQQTLDKMVADAEKLLALMEGPA